MKICYLPFQHNNKLTINLGFEPRIRVCRNDRFVTIPLSERISLNFLNEFVFRNVSKIALILSLL